MSILFSYKSTCFLSWGIQNVPRGGGDGEGGGSSLSVRSLCEKNCLIFLSPLAVAKSFAVLSLVQHKGVF